MAKKQRRFVISNKEGALEGTTIITDSETGVQYLFASTGYAGGIPCWWTKTASRC